MPQLDKVTFISQFFWLCITFFSTYLILVKFYLPALARIIKVRNAISNRTEERENTVANVSSPITAVYSSTIAGSMSAFQSRLEILEKWNSNQLQSIVPRLAPEFEHDMVSFLKEVAFSDAVLDHVMPLVLRRQNLLPVHSRFCKRFPSRSDKFITASVSESLLNN
jgi:hypothetical protein